MTSGIASISGEDTALWTLPIPITGCPRIVSTLFADPRRAPCSPARMPLRRALTAAPLRRQDYTPEEVEEVKKAHPWIYDKNAK